jgi:hypothetical protein
MRSFTQPDVGGDTEVLEQFCMLDFTMNMEAASKKYFSVR